MILPHESIKNWKIALVNISSNLVCIRIVLISSTYWTIVWSIKWLTNRAIIFWRATVASNSARCRQKKMDSNLKTILLSFQEIWPKVGLAISLKHIWFIHKHILCSKKCILNQNLSNYRTIQLTPFKIVPSKPTSLKPRFLK